MFQKKNSLFSQGQLAKAVGDWQAIIKSGKMSLHLFRCIKLNFEQVIIAGSNPEGICELIKPCQQKY